MNWQLSIQWVIFRIRFNGGTCLSTICLAIFLLGYHLKFRPSTRPNIYGIDTSNKSDPEDLPLIHCHVS